MTLQKAEELKKRLDKVAEYDTLLVDVQIVSSATGYLVDVVSSGCTLGCLDYLNALDGNVGYFVYAERNHAAMRFTYWN